MATINIRGLEAIDDPAYRYKMPKIIGKVEGRGNGIKTRIVNITELATSLHRDPGEVCKFFGCELGAQTKWVEEEEKALVNGAHSDNDLQQMVFRYCQAFVLCPNCRLPETDYKIKSETIWHKCMACGAKEMVDMQHKLTTYILGNVKKAKLAEKAKKKKEEKKKKKKKSKDDDEEDQDMDDSSEKKKKEKKDKKKKKKKDKKRESGSENEDGSGSGSEEDAAAAGAAAGLGGLSVEDQSAFDTGVESVRRFLAAPGWDTPLLMEELRVAQTLSSFPAHFRVHLLVAAAFAEGPVGAAEVAARAADLRAAHNGNPILARHMIGAFELLCARRRPELKPLLPAILKFCFDEDVLEEELILEWAEDEGRTEYSPEGVSAEELAELKALCAPLVTWLEEAEDEDDSEGEEEEEEDEEG